MIIIIIITDDDHFIIESCRGSIVIFDVVVVDAGLFGLVSVLSVVVEVVYELGIALEFVSVSVDFAHIMRCSCQAGMVCGRNKIVMHWMGLALVYK